MSQEPHAATLQEQVVDEARHLLMKLDNARKWQAERDDREAVRQIDFAIGVTFALRKTVADHDEAVGRRVEV